MSTMAKRSLVCVAVRN